ncbi:MAG: hypothetical protein ACI85I_000920 [Arenicella sp.]
MLKYKKNTKMKFMKITFALIFFSTFLFSSAFAQDKSKRKSPPMKAETNLKGGNVKIEYGAPSTRGREVWGKLVPYNKIWRTGANEATTFEIEKDVEIDGKLLKAGKYALFTIPDANEWTIIFNSNPNQWGAYNYDPELDVLRVKVKPTASKTPHDQFKVDISKKGEVRIFWDKLAVPFEVKAI